MQRTILGVLAILLLLSAAVLWLVWPDVGGSVSLAFCWRTGMVMAAAWLAYDDIQRLPGWLLATLPVLLIVLARWPKFFIMAIPVVVVLAFIYSRLAQR